MKITDDALYLVSLVKSGDGCCVLTPITPHRSGLTIDLELVMHTVALAW